MGRKLPPFAALRAFEAAARRGSLQAAAEELLISTSAVSHQVKALEIFLGVKLFTREPAGLRPTPAGADYLASVGDALDQLEAGTLRLLKTREDGGLRLHILQSIAQLWLIPQLDDFVSENPDVTIGFVSRPDEVDFSGDDIDLAIVYAASPPNEHIVDRLVEEVMIPVCAPGYLAEHGPIERPEDLLSHRLIGCDHMPGEWPDWLAAQHLGSGAADTTAPRTQLLFDSRAQALRAAAEGLGVAMNRRPTGDEMMRRGALVAPLGAAVPTGAAYWLIAPERSELLSSVKRFRAWLASRCAA